MSVLLFFDVVSKRRFIQTLNTNASVFKLVILLLLFSLGSGGCKQQKRAEQPAATDEKSGDAAAKSRLVMEKIARDPVPGQFSILDMKLEPFVFDTPEFPVAEFANPDLVKKTFGDYSLSTVYYGADYNVVKTAATPGRYGAVVHVAFANGVGMDRYYTLYRYASDTNGSLQWWRWAAFTKDPVQLNLPAALGVDNKVASEYNDAISVFIRFGFYEDLIKRPYSARLLASLGEKKGTDDKSLVQNDPIVQDRQWWINLKQKIHPASGFPVAGEKISQKALAPAEKTVSLKSAAPEMSGMKAGVSAQLDKVLTKWTGESKEPFTVLLARNGNIFFQKAYGERSGKRAGVEDRYHIASINKTLTAILLMMCVDKKLLTLDDDITRFFPTLKDAKWNKPITIRHLATHTSGLPDLTLDEANDLEEIIKPLLPYITVGGSYNYVETGYSLIGKILETVTGECYARLAKEWISEPMQLKSLTVKGAASDAWISPQDLAKVGQMLLNEGSLDGIRYFDRNVYAQMLPKPEDFQGIGLMRVGGAQMADKPTAQLRDEWLRDVNVQNNELGFGKLLGHGASSGTSFAIDPDNKVVIIMTRNNFGSNYATNNKMFMKTIGENIVH